MLVKYGTNVLFVKVAGLGGLAVTLLYRTLITLESFKLMRRMRAMSRPQIVFLSSAALAALAIGWYIHYHEAALKVQAVRISAAQGDPDAEVDLGSRYFHGDGVPQDYNEALRWFRRSADRGSPSGQYHVGVMFYYGHAVPQNYTEASNLFFTAAEQGYPTAQDQLGTMYAYGIGFPRDEERAFTWYIKSAQRGYARGQEHLGTMYYFGRGTGQDYVEAARWFRKAADQGDSAAAYDLCVMSESGRGVPRNLGQAGRWLIKSAIQGNNTALKIIALCAPLAIFVLCLAIYTLRSAPKFFLYCSRRRTFQKANPHHL